MTRTFFRKSVRDPFFASLVFLLCISLPWGCGNDVQDLSTEGPSDTGSTSLTIRWHDTQVFPNSMALQTSLNCQASGIEHVVCNVYDTSTDRLLVTGGPWDCEAHTGTVKGIPAGQDRTFVVMAEDSNGNVKWRGEVTGVAIIAGNNNENVGVDTYPFIPSLIFPNNGDIVDPDAFSLEWEPFVDAVEYIVQVATDADFFDIVIDQTTPSLTYEPATLIPSTKYHWRISGIDRFANIGAESETRDFITRDCSYSISSTNNTIGSSGGTGSFRVSTSSTRCQWQAETNAKWVTITSEPSNIGNGTVTYRVSPNTSDSRTAAITIAGQTHTVNQEPALGALKVTINPPEAVLAGARWRVDGGDWNSSGFTQNGLSLGNHLLEFNTIPGWIKPTTQTVTINNNQTTDTSGAYSQRIVIDLSVYTYNASNNRYAFLTWSGADSRSVDVYRDSSLIDTANNVRLYTDGPIKEKTPITYQICEAGTANCSNRVNVSW